jgi:hypothetical protein
LASAQFTDNDGCDHAAQGVPDANGGCNVAGNPFQDLGSFGVGNLVTVSGTFGTYSTDGGATYTTRDLDWYTITLTQDSFVTFTLTSNAAQNVLFLGANGGTCPATIFYGVQAGTPQTTQQYLTAGTYTVIATTPFEPNSASPIYACSSYTLSIDIQAGNAACGTGATSQACTVASSNPGCNDWECCNIVCIADPLCCDIAWDQNCVTNGAVAICGYFIYSCPPGPGAPANNCVGAATLVGLDTVVTFDTTNATTDGPSNLVTGAPALMGKDIWFVVQSPGNGQLSVNSCDGTSFDQVIELYALGNSPVVSDPTTLPDLYIGQVDDTCGITAGPAQLTLIDAVEGEYYLIRIGGWRANPADPGAAGPGSFIVTFATQIYNTGPQRAVTINGALANGGLSSGALSVAQPRRWLARPFTVSEPTNGDNAVVIEEIIGKGFIPAGVTTTNLHYIIWSRAEGNPAPVESDQIATGVVPATGNYDDPLDSAANASWPITVDPPVVLCPGTYYLTIYGSNPNDYANGGQIPSNWAWFIYSLEGERLLEPGGLAFSWRSSNFPSPGFVAYGGSAPGLPATWQVQPGDDPNALYTNSFQIIGSTTTSESCGGGKEPCVGDLDGDNNVGAADLAILLGQWGGAGSGDLDGSGSVGAADLALLLGAWGSCGG